MSAGKTISVHGSDELHEALGLIARTRGMTRSAAAREVLEDYVRVYGRELAAHEAKRREEETKAVEALISLVEKI